VDGTGAVGAVNMAYLNMVGDICNRTIEFIDQVYIPDLLAIAGFYKDWAQWGGGLSGKNVMSYGEFPEIANDYSNASMALPAGVILNGDLSKVLPSTSRPWTKCRNGSPTPGTSTATRRRDCTRSTGVTEPNFVLGKGTKGTRTASRTSTRPRSTRG